jgi:GNAT superfamily N-acetyltransferase
VDLALREATLADAAAIAKLHADSWRYAYRGSYSDVYLDGPVFEDRARMWQERLSSPQQGQYVVLAEEGGELVGFACAFGADDPKWGTLLDNLHARPDLHRRGIGRRLVADVARWSRQAYPEDGLFLWVLEKNERARGFYARLGGADVESKESEAPGGRIIGHRIVWTPEQLAALTGSV